MELLATFSSRIQADLLGTRLESYGIPFMIQGDDAAGWDPALALTNGVRVYVPAEDLLKARDLCQLK